MSRFFIDPAIPAILHPSLADYCASLRVDLPNHFTYYSCLPGLRAVFSIVEMYANLRLPADEPRPWLDELCECFPPHVREELLRMSTSGSPEGWDEHPSGDLAPAFPVFLEFENGTVLKADTSEWGDLKVFPGVRSCP